MQTKILSSISSSPCRLHQRIRLQENAKNQVGGEGEPVGEGEEEGVADPAPHLVHRVVLLQVLEQALLQMFVPVG